MIFFYKVEVQFFIRLTKFSFFDQAASFDLNFLARPHRFFQNCFTGSLVYHVDAENHILFIWYLNLSYPTLADRGVGVLFLV